MGKFTRRGTINRGTVKPLSEKKPKKDAYDIFRKSFDFIDKPEKSSPTMPKKVSEYKSAEISDLMFKISAWRDYTDDLIYEATRNFLRTKEAHQYAMDIAMLTTTGNTVKEKEAKIRSRKDIKELRDKMLEDEMLLDLLERKYESYTNNITIISREITRRGSME